MRTVGIGVTHVIENTHIAIMKGIRKCFQLRVQSHFICNGQGLCFFNTQFGPGAVINIIAYRNNGIQSIIAATKLQHHHYFISGWNQLTGFKSLQEFGY